LIVLASKVVEYIREFNDKFREGRRLRDIPVSTSRHEQIILKVEAGQAAFVPHECIEAFARSEGGGAVRTADW
jgi:hypothetical protein